MQTFGSRWRPQIEPSSDPQSTNAIALESLVATIAMHYGPRSIVLTMDGDRSSIEIRTKKHLHRCTLAEDRLRDGIARIKENLSYGRNNEGEEKAYVVFADGPRKRLYGYNLSTDYGDTQLRLHRLLPVRPQSPKIHLPVIEAPLLKAVPLQSLMDAVDWAKSVGAQEFEERLGKELEMRSICTPFDYSDITISGPDRTVAIEGIKDHGSAKCIARTLAELDPAFEDAQILRDNTREWSVHCTASQQPAKNKVA